MLSSGEIGFPSFSLWKKQNKNDNCKIEINKVNKECYLISHDNIIYKFSIKIYFWSNKVKKERYIIREDNTIYKYSIKFSFSSIDQHKSKLQKQISRLLILSEMAAWLEGQQIRLI